MTARIWFWAWTWHILAGAAGVLLSLGVFYQWLERRFNAYKKLRTDDVDRIVDESGQELSDMERATYIAFFNGLTDMGNVSLPNAKYREGKKITMKSGSTYDVVTNGQFREVQLTKRNGKKVIFRLYDKQ